MSDSVDVYKRQVMTGGGGVGAVGYLLEKNLPGGGFRPGVAQGVEARWVA